MFPGPPNNAVQFIFLTVTICKHLNSDITTILITFLIIEESEFVYLQVKLALLILYLKIYKMKYYILDVFSDKNETNVLLDSEVS